eukprot:gene1658-biopygen9511
MRFWQSEAELPRAPEALRVPRNAPEFPRAPRSVTEPRERHAEPRSATECRGAPWSATECHGAPQSATQSATERPSGEFVCCVGSLVSRMNRSMAECPVRYHVTDAIRYHVTLDAVRHQVTLDAVRYGETNAVRYVYGGSRS